MMKAMSWLFKACLLGGVVAAAVLTTNSQRLEQAEKYRRIEATCQLTKVDTSRRTTVKEWLCPNGVTYSLNY